MAHEELLNWAEGRPPWQRDGLRRLALQGELTPEDLTALRLQIQQAAGLPAEGAPASVPLAQEHVGQTAGNSPKTVLASLGPVRHVDRLASDQPPLRFAINGVTLVYGPNASGKSGYCRIARRLCHSLGTTEIRSNVYDRARPNRQEVNVAFRVGGDDQPKQELNWRVAQEPPAELSRISVFDSASARVYVDMQRRIEFLPYELDLMNKLGLACRALDREFRERLSIVDEALRTRLPEGYHEGTKAQKIVARLTLQTAINDLPSEDYLRELSTWTASKQTKLDKAKEQLNQDPQVMIRRRVDAKRALEAVREEVSMIEVELADAAIAAIRAKHLEAEAASQAAEASAKKLFSGQPIPDLGSEAWRRMLSYAREFAGTVFPDAPPPPLASGGLCVLCQQALDENATARMAAFDGYIADRASEDSEAAMQALASHRGRLLALRIKPRREVETLLSGYANLSEACKQNEAAMAVFVEKAGERLNAVKLAMRENDYDSLQSFDKLPASPSDLIEEEIGRLNAEIAELTKSERDEKAFARLRSRHFELADEKRLSEQIEIIVERRNRLVERQRLDNCIRQCRSGAITRRITDRRRAILTPTLRAALAEELDRLKLKHIPLNMTDRGDIAESIVEISLDARQRVANNSDVLSEGEQRALALACFLAELQEIGGDHGIIVDDPVSSLDHSRMEAVAERLAEEASKGRQVIVFTHNILFHHMLWAAALRAQVGRHSEWMNSFGNDRFGLIDESQKPRQMKRIPQRLDEIRKEFAKIEKSGYDQADQNFLSDITGLYTYMRETWERTIEEILFNNVVQRFRPDIMTKRLEQAFIDPKADYPIIFQGMTRCSHFSGHDRAPDIPPGLPTPNEIKQDIAYLENFAKSATARRQKLGKARSYEDGVEAVLL